MTALEKLSINVVEESKKDFENLINEIIDDAREFVQEEHSNDLNEFLNDDQYGILGMVNEYWNLLRKYIPQSKKDELIEYITNQLKQSKDE